MSNGGCAVVWNVLQNVRNFIGFANKVKQLIAKGWGHLSRPL
jgi:hypothetical protein